MARKPRLRVPGGLYHVLLRGNARQDVLFSPADRALFYALLADGVARFGCRVFAFCLLTNLAQRARAGRSGGAVFGPA